MKHFFYQFHRLRRCLRQPRGRILNLLTHVLSASLCDFLFAFTGYEQYQEAGGNAVTVSVKGECASKTEGIFVGKFILCFT